MWLRARPCALKSTAMTNTRQTPLQITLLGADGRMGLALAAQIATHSGAQLAAAITAPSSPHLGQDIGEVAGLAACGVTLTDDLRAGLDACDVLIDFSAPKAAIDAALMMHDVRCRAMVSGTTGFSLSEDKALDVAAQSVCLVQSGNFSLGVNMLAALVRRAAKSLPDWDVEIFEMHHRHKVDAPSGTALMLGDAAAKGRSVALSDVAALSRSGAKAQRKPGQIGFAALRGGGVVGEHEARIASELEMLTLGHLAFDRSVFAAGALTAAIWAAQQPKGIYDMSDVLGID